jgi:hypothetical protein
MSSRRFRTSLLLVVLAGCGGPQTPEPKLAAKPLDKHAVIVKPAVEVPAPTADLSADILATITGGSLDAFLRVGAGYVAPHLPAAFQPMVQPDTLRAQLFKAVHIDGLEAALDPSRPFAIAVADPSIYRTRGELGPILLAVPVKDGGELVNVFARRADKHETTPWKDHAFTSASGRGVYLRLQQGYALLASQEKLLHGAAGQLLPQLRGVSGARVRAEVKLGLIGDRFGHELDKALASLRRLMNRPADAGKAGVVRRLERWLGLARGMQTANALLELEPGRARLKLDASAKPSGPFQSYLAALPVGEPWGARFLPKDAAVFVLSRDDAQSRLSDVNDAFELMRTLTGEEGGKILDTLRAGLEAVLKQLGGESAAAIWVSGNGGIGLGGALKVKDAKAAQAELAKLTASLGKELKRIVEKATEAKLARALTLVDPAQRKKLEAAARREMPVPSLRVKRGGAKLAGVTVDVYELGIAWPKLRGEEAKRVAELRKKVDKVIGLPFTIGFGAVGEVGVIAMGKEWKKRLSELCATAKGGAGAAAVEKNLAAVAGGKRVALLAHADVTALIEGGMRVADQLATVPSDVRDQVNKILPGKEVPISALVYKEGESLHAELRTSADLFGMLTKAGLVLFMARAGGSMPMPVPPPPAPAP